VEVPGKTQPMAAAFERPDGLLKGFLIGLANAHHLADGPHLGSQFVFDPPELLEGPAGEFHDHIVPPGGVFVEGPFSPVGHLIQGEAPRKAGGNHGDGKAGRLGSQRGRPGGPRVDFDHHHPAGPGVVGELDVGAADDFDGFHDIVGIFLEPLLQFRGNGQHGRGAVRISRVHAHGVDIFNETDRDPLVLGIPYHFEFQLFPAQDRLLDQNLADETGRDPATGNGAQFFHVVDQASPGSTHGVGRAHDDRVSQFRGNTFRFLDAESRLAPG